MEMVELPRLGLKKIGRTGARAKRVASQHGRGPTICLPWGIACLVVKLSGNDKFYEGRHTLKNVSRRRFLAHSAMAGLMGFVSPIEAFSGRKKPYPGETGLKFIIVSC